MPAVAFDRSEVGLPVVSATPVSRDTASVVSVSIDSPESRLRATVEGFLTPIVRFAGARAGAVCAITSEGGPMHRVAAVAVPTESSGTEPHIDACGSCGLRLAEESGEPVPQALSSCPRLSSADAGCVAYAGSIAVPLTFRTRSIGVLTLFFDAVSGIHAEVLPVLRPMGDLLGLTLDNVRLERERLDALLSAERQAMANDIHDALAQSVAFTRMRMPLLADAVRAHDDDRALRYCDDVSGELAAANRRLRELITTFRAGMDAHGLVRAIEQLIVGLRRREGLVVDWENRLTLPLALRAETEVQAYRIVHEALANVVRHSGASRVRVRLANDNTSLSITVHDNGRGMATDPSKAAAGESCGIRIMHERARSIGGSVDISPLSGGGTSVVLRLPNLPGDAPND